MGNSSRERFSVIVTVKLFNMATAGFIDKLTIEGVYPYKTESKVADSYRSVADVI